MFDHILVAVFKKSGENMEQTYFITQIDVGFHPDGYRIDKNDSPIGPYTKWEVHPNGQWCKPQSVRIEDLPLNGWIKTDKFVWDGIKGPVDITVPILLRSTTKDENSN